MPCNRVCSGVLTTNRMSSTITTSRQHWRLAGKRKWDVTEYDHWCSRSRGQEAHRLKNTRIRSLAASWLVRVAWFGTVLAWLNSKHSNFYLLFSSSGSVIDYSSFLSFFSLDSRWNFESATCFLPPKLNLFWCFAGFWFDSVDSFPVLAEFGWCESANMFLNFRFLLNIISSRGITVSEMNCMYIYWLFRYDFGGFPCCYLMFLWGKDLIYELSDLIYVSLVLCVENSSWNLRLFEIC